MPRDPSSNFIFASWSPTTTGHVIQHGKADPDGRPTDTVYTLDEADLLYRGESLIMIGAAIDALTDKRPMDLSALVNVYELGRACHDTRNHQRQPRKAGARLDSIAPAPAHSGSDHR